MKYFTLLVTLTLSTLCNNILANDNRGDSRERIEPKGFLYGIGLGINQEIYKGYNHRTIPMPIIGYRGDKFSILGPFFSYDALSFSELKLSLLLAPRFQGFDDSDSFIFENMADRKLSMDAGLGFSYEKNDWKMGVSTLLDILGRSDGYETKANISRVMKNGPFFIEPSLSLSYLDHNHVNYYYGVQTNEINAFTSTYKGESALNTTLGLSVSTPIFLGGFTRLSLDYTWYDSAITNSPLVEKDTSLSARFIFSKFF